MNDFPQFAGGSNTGIRFTFQTNADTLRANFYKKHRNLAEHFREAVVKHGEISEVELARIAPKRYHFMVRHIHLDFTGSPDNFVLGYYAHDFQAAGLYFYPPAVEYGTSRSRAYPSLTIVARRNRMRLKNEIARIIARG